MPRRIDKPGDVRFLTFSCYRRLPLFSNDAIKDAFTEHLARCRDDMAFRLYAWVVMPEHVHLLVFPDVGRCPMPVLLRSLKEPFAREVLRRWRRLDARILARVTDPRGQARFWQRGGGYDRNIRSESDLNEKMDYIHTNPVRRGLVTRPEEWRWSSARSFTRGCEETILIDRREVFVAFARRLAQTTAPGSIGFHHGRFRHPRGTNPVVAAVLHTPHGLLLLGTRRSAQPSNSVIDVIRGAGVRELPDQGRSTCVGRDGLGYAVLVSPRAKIEAT